MALSFPGEKRDFVEKVAAELAATLGQKRVLYDEYLTAELARPDLDVYLARLYREDSELLVPFFCSDYEKKEWCGLEWRQMRDLQKRKQAAQIMPFRFDDTPIPGVLSIDGYIKVGGRSAQQVAKLILERLHVIGGEAPATVATSAPATLRPEPTVTADAAKLLLAMAKAEDGSLLHSSSHSGYGITIGGRDFLPDTMSQRVRARWQRAIRELATAELIEEDGPSGEIFVLTDAGYVAADALRAKADAPTPGATGLAFATTDMKNVAQFFREAEDLIAEEPDGGGHSVAVEIATSPAAFLRVHPVMPVDELPSELAAKRLAAGKLFPMGAATSGAGWSRNEMGALAYTARLDGKLTNFSQLFLSGEICGVDLLVVRRVHVDGAKSTFDRTELRIYDFELSCALALANFVKFTRVSLKYAGPLRVMGGLQGIKGCKLCGNLRLVGNALKDEIHWAGELSGIEPNVADFLRPLFEKVWDSFGVTRFPEAEQQLAANLRA